MIEAVILMKKFICRDFTLSLGKKTYIMGILNVTPDSFSDGGKYLATENAVAHAKKMESEGADIIDVGAASTRPFSDAVTPQEEWQRLEKVLPAIISSVNIPVSVDTYNRYVAEKCLKLGVSIINDVSGVFSSDLADIIKKYNAGWILMHGGVMLGDAGSERDYKEGIISSVNGFFEEVRKKAEENLFPLSNICVDPGFGFSKNTLQNTQLLESFDELNASDLPLLCALSRKRFIGELSSSPDVNDRLMGTLAANASAVIKGADILRVHDVKEHRRFFDVIDTLYR